MSAKWRCEEWGTPYLLGKRCELRILKFTHGTFIQVRIDDKCHHEYEIGQDTPRTRKHARVLFNAIEGKV